MILKNRIACRICLSTDVKFYHVEAFELKSYYEEIINEALTEDDELLHFFCYQCSALLQKYHSFRELCVKSQKALKKISIQNLDIPFEVTLKWEQNNNKIHPFISKFNKNSNLGYFKYKEYDITINQSQDQQLASDSTQNVENSNTYLDDEENLTFLVINNDANECDFEESMNQEPNNIEKSITTEDIGRDLDLTKWRVELLSQDEASKQYHEQVQKQKHKLRYNKYVCEYCQRTFKDQKLLNNHQVYHSEDKGPHECFLCKKRYLTQLKLNQHMKLHLVKYHCLQCPQVFSNKHYTVIHKSYHEGLQYDCQYCDATFEKKSTYYSHLRIVHRSSHLCPHCGTSFVSELGVKHHVKRMHKSADTGALATYCGKCDMVFENPQAFEDHKQNSDKHITEEDHDQSIKQLKGTRYVKICEQCGEQFWSVVRYNRHLQLAHKIGKPRIPSRSTVCEICGLTIQLHQLPIHMDIHEGKRFPCPHCDKHFSSATNRERHLRLHVNPKPYTCQLCSNSFTTRHSQRQHMKTVHLKQPYPPKKTRMKIESLDGEVRDEM